MANNNENDNDNNPNDVSEIQSKLENTNISTQNEASPGNDMNNNDDKNKETNPVSNKDDAQNEETKVEEQTDSAQKNANDTNAEQQEVENSNVAANNNNNDNNANNNNNQQQQLSQQQQQQQTQQGPADNKETEDDRTNLIINYLPPTMSEGTLATLFSPYGLLERCKIVVDLQTLRSRGYGFVKYDNAVSAERALTALNGYELNGKKLKVAFARAQCKAITNANLYITNIPQHYVDNNLRKLFDDYGKIVECRVLLDQNGQSRGVGFVRMDTHHNAIQALQAMDQYVIDDKHPPLLVKLAQRRVPRRYWNTQNRNQGGGQNKYQNQGAGGNLSGGNKKKKKKNSPNRKYYPKGGDMGGVNMNGPPMGGNMGGNMNRGSPSKRGYYRPRNQQFKQNNQQKAQYSARRGGGNNNNNPNQGPPYFPAPMYQDAPYGMTYGGQPYAANIHMAAPQINNPSNAPNQGPKRNKPIGNWD